MIVFRFSMLKMLKMWQYSSDAYRTAANTFQISVITGGFTFREPQFLVNTKYAATVFIFLYAHTYTRAPKAEIFSNNHHNNIIHPFVDEVSIQLLRSLRVQFINSGQRFVTKFFVFLLQKKEIFGLFVKWMHMVILVAAINLFTRCVHWL